MSWSYDLHNYLLAFLNISENIHVAAHKPVPFKTWANAANQMRSTHDVNERVYFH